MRSTEASGSGRFVASPRTTRVDTSGTFPVGGPASFGAGGGHGKALLCIVDGMTSPASRTLDHHVGEHRDERNKLFSVRRLLPTAWPVSVFWTPGPALLDQRDTGHCGGFAAANEAQATPVRVKGVTNDWAHDFYYQIK